MYEPNNFSWVFNIGTTLSKIEICWPWSWTVDNFSMLFCSRFIDVDCRQQLLQCSRFLLIRQLECFSSVEKNGVVFLENTCSIILVSKTQLHGQVIHQNTGCRVYHADNLWCNTEEFFYRQIVFPCCLACGSVLLTADYSIAAVQQNFCEQDDSSLLHGWAS